MTTLFGPVYFLPQCSPPLDDNILNSTCITNTNWPLQNTEKNLNISTTSGSHKCMDDDHECFNSRSSAGGQLSSRDVPENVKPDALDGVKRIEEDYHPSAPLRTCHRTRFIIYKATTLLMNVGYFQCLQCSCTLYVYRCLCVDFLLIKIFILQSLYTQINAIWFTGWAKKNIYMFRNKPAIKDMQSAQVREGLHVTCKHNGNAKTRDNTRHFKVSWNVNCTSQILYVETLRIALRTYVQKWLNTWLLSINQKRKWCIKRYRA